MRIPCAQAALYLDTGSGHTRPRPYSSGAYVYSAGAPPPENLSECITTQSNKPPLLPAVYVYSRRASSEAIHTETRLCKRTSYDMHRLPAPQGTHADAPAGEYVPAQHRHASETDMRRFLQRCCASPAALCCNTPCRHTSSTSKERVKHEYK